jgi:mRNA interferase MazF
MSVKRGDIYYADLSPVVGSEQGGLRPVLIIQNDVGNRYSPTVIAAAITSRLGKNRLPTHIDVYADRVGLVKDSVILLEQVRTLDKRRLKEKMGHLDEDMMVQVNRAIAVSVGLGDWQPGEAPAYVASSQTPSTAVPTPTSTPAPTLAPMPAAAASVAPEVGVGATMAAPDVSPSMAAELTTAVAASPEFGEVSDGDVVR